MVAWEVVTIPRFLPEPASALLLVLVAFLVQASSSAEDSVAVEAEGFAVVVAEDSVVVHQTALHLALAPEAASAAEVDSTIAVLATQTSSHCLHAVAIATKTGIVTASVTIVSDLASATILTGLATATTTAARSVHTAAEATTTHVSAAATEHALSKMSIMVRHPKTRFHALGKYTDQRSSPQQLTTDTWLPAEAHDDHPRKQAST